MPDARRENEENDRMPILFVGHGSPMNAIEDNRWSRGFSALRTGFPEPRAILAISAHWFVEGSLLTSNIRPPTIHDFSGFPPALYEINYPAPGAANLARQVRSLIGPARAGLSANWGMDHGTWSVLRWMYPEANIPVVQLSIDRRLDARQHFELAQSLSDLREEGVLILASGNIVHNLQDAFARKRQGNDETPRWAGRFDDAVLNTLQQRDTANLLAMATNTGDGRKAHPTPDHWLPLIYAYGASDDKDSTRFPVSGFDWGSISMRSVMFG